MRANEINLIGGFYADDARHWSVQDTVNWLPVMAEQPGTRTLSKLETPPGLRPYRRIGTGPIRGMYDCEGMRFVVSGRTLYRITAQGAGIPVGTIPGVGRVSMSHNQFKSGNQLLVTNGAAGGGYVYDTMARTFGRITDDGYPGSISNAYVDSYLLGVEPGGRFWFHSNLADAEDYNTLDRYEAEAAPDRIVGLAVSQFEVVVFGERTTEFFGNAGGATGTFQSKRIVIDRGCASRHTIQNMDNSVFWLGNDGIVYRLDGYSAQRISTVPLEKAISGKRWQDAFAFTWEDRGHKVYYLSFPDGRTWGYDVVSGLWTRRESFGLKRWRLTDTVKWAGKWYGGDFQDGRIWLLDWDYPAEGDQPMVRERTSPVYADNQSAFNVPRIELLFQVGSRPIDDLVGNGGFPPPPPPSLTLTGSIGAQLYADAPTSGNYVVSGGVGPYFFQIIEGALPPGVELSPSGEWTGAAAQTGTFQWKVAAYDSTGAWAALDDMTVVVAAPYYLLHYYDTDGFRDYGSLGLHFTPEALDGGVLPYIAVSPGGGHAGRFTSGADTNKRGRLRSAEPVDMSGDWTMETQVYNLGGNSGQCMLMGVRAVGFWTGLHISAGTGRISGWVADSNTPFYPMTANQWHHVVWQRRGTTFELFLDGVLLIARTNITTGLLSDVAELGTWLNGYLRESRMTIGRAVYPSGGFNPPTERHKPVDVPLVGGG